MIYKLGWAFRAILLAPFFGSMGRFSYLGKPTYIHGFRRIFIGNKVRIMPGARIEVHGDGRFTIHDNCSIGNGLHVASGGDLVIETGALISSNVLITDMDHAFEDTELPVFDQPMLLKHTHIGKNVFVGAGAKILAGSEIGDGCVVAANSVVRGIFTAHSVLAGMPAKVVKRYDVVSCTWLKAN